MLRVPVSELDRDFYQQYQYAKFQFDSLKNATYNLRVYQKIYEVIEVPVHAFLLVMSYHLYSLSNVFTENIFKWKCQRTAAVIKWHNFCTHRNIGNSFFKLEVLAIFQL